MGKATDILMGEHRVIEKVLAALDSCAAGAREGQEVPREIIRDFAEFFMNFADRYHHAKEEDMLFAEMVRFGFPREHGPIAVMLADHAVGRRQVAMLLQIGNGSGALSDEERTVLAEQAGDYAAMLSSHIQREDVVLFPMADRMLPADSLARLANDFDAFEKDVMGEEARKKYHRLAEKLTAAFPRTDAPQ